MDFSSRARELGCRYCNGKLHSAFYLRKGRLAELEIPDGWELFYSLCCSREGCRKRIRPPSVRYAGRSPNCSILVLLAHLITSGASQRSIQALSKELGISERTARRWLELWKRVFRISTWWRKLASLWNLSGQNLFVLWQMLLRSESEHVAIKNILRKSADLWEECRFIVGPEPPAEVARAH